MFTDSYYVLVSLASPLFFKKGDVRLWPARLMYMWQSSSTTKLLFDGKIFLLVMHTLAYTCSEKDQRL